MRGSRAVFLGAFGAFAVVASLAPPAAACVADLSPPALHGIPARDATDVPTDVIPVFSYFGAKIDTAGLSLATFELVADGREPIPLRALRTYVTYFELAPVPAVELAPRVTYSLNATLVLVSGESAEASLTFTTGDGPLDEVPEPPPVGMQNYVAADAPPPLCGGGRASSCIFFGTDRVVDLTFTGPDLETVRYLAFAPFLWNLTGEDVTAGYDCVLARTRATDGLISESLTLCGVGAQRFDLATTNGLACTANGLTVDGMLLGGSGGGSGGVGGSSETGGSGAVGGSSETGGSGNSAGAPVDPDGSETRVVVTEGCGCALPGRAPDSRFALAVAALVAFARRRSALPGRRVSKF